ncbi:MAG: hypothetical protein V1495_08010 [Pseudomonadota bacterium]
MPINGGHTTVSKLSDEQVVRTARVIWAALFVSLFLYATIAFQLKPGSHTPASPETLKSMETFFPIVAILAMFFGFLLPRLLLRAEAKRTPGGIPLARRLNHFIVRLAFFESIAILGFILAAQASEGKRMWPFLIISAFGFLRSLPSREKLEGL